MKTLTQSLKTIALALVLALGVSYVSAWTAPTTAPTGGNVASPLNIGNAEQYKIGALGVGGVLRSYNNLVVDGNVGVGTTAPLEKLDVMGNVFLSGSNKGLRLQNDIGASFWASTPQDGMMSIGGTGATPPSSGPLNILATGNIGIGTINPSQTLDVDGSIQLTGDILKKGVPCTGGTVNQVWNGHCYSAFLQENDNWFDTQSMCRILGGYLTVITSEEENTFVDSLIGNNIAWIGGFDLGNEGTWVWANTSNEPWSYTKWDSGEPNNQDNEDCLALLGDRGRWNDGECSSGLRFVCERNY